MIDQTFGRLKVIAIDGKIAVCECSCGNLFSGSKYNIKAGGTRSCGCLAIEIKRALWTKHGYAVSNVKGIKRSEYRAWGGIISRCHNEKNPSYPRYGGKGTRVCDRWRFGEDGLSGFQCFIADMGDKPSPHHSIDRIKNELGYEPTNCRWATPVGQARNKTTTTMIDYRGERMPLQTACEIAGLSANAVVQRIDYLGWSVERALSEPIRTQKRIVEVDEQNLNLHQAAIRSGLNYSLVYARVKRFGWSVERALNTPARYHGK